MKQKLQILDRQGPEDYSATLSVQTNLLEAKISDRQMSDMLILVEHSHVFTVGRKVEFQETFGKAKDVKWVEVGRGGKATYHGPGQLVAYPIFDLKKVTVDNQGERKDRGDINVYLRKLEQVGVEFLSKFGIEAHTIEGLTGVWTKSEEPKKLISIGIGVRKWVSFHGISINIEPDLDYFKAISACGNSGESITSLRELGVEIPSSEVVRQKLVDSFVSVFNYELEDEQQAVKRRARPSWLKVKAPGSPDFLKTLDVVKEHKLVTVCEEARCPNMGECWAHGTATFMIMGENCTRRCSFCSVKDGTLSNLSELDPFEPFRVGQAVEKLGLKHVVITSVNRDDLEDMGALHFDRTAKAIAKHKPDCAIEFLIPDMRGRRELVEKCLQSSLVSVLNHNIETVPRLYRKVRPGAVFTRSLNILRWATEIQPDIRSKSGIMLGLGEQPEEVLEVMDALRESNVKVLTIGQYLQPSKKQLPVKRFVTPEEFEFYKVEGQKRGFLHVESGPLVRSSYHAWSHTGAEAPHLSDLEKTEQPEILKV